MGDIRTITIELEALISGSTIGTLEYTMNPQVMRAGYDIYVFNEGALRDQVGPFEERIVELTVRVLHTDRRQHRPVSGSSPAGGFRNSYHICEVLSVHEAGK